MANRSVNKVILIGNLGKDAETQTTPSGIPVSRFAIATTRSWKDSGTNEWKEETNWTNVVLWRQENVAGYLTKGKQLSRAHDNCFYPQQKFMRSKIVFVAPAITFRQISSA